MSSTLIPVIGIAVLAIALLIWLFPWKKLERPWKAYKAQLATIDWPDVVVRSMKTFVQIAVTYGISALSGINYSKELGGTFWIGFLLSAGSAGIAAVWNTVLFPVLNTDKQVANLAASLSGRAIMQTKNSSDAQPFKDDSNG